MIVGFPAELGDAIARYSEMLYYGLTEDTEQ